MGMGGNYSDGRKDENRKAELLQELVMVQARKDGVEDFGNTWSRG